MSLQVNRRNTHIGLSLGVAMLGLAGFTSAALEFDPDGLVSVETSAIADSVTVGERFSVEHVFTYPDSLRMLPWDSFEAGKNRLLSVTWDEHLEDARKRRSARMLLITLDLEEATLPASAVDFETPAGDTVRVFTREVTIPVRHLAAQSSDIRPLKTQWESPRSYLAWILAAAGSIVAAVLLWWWWWRRKRRVEEAPPEPQLPADYIALTELTRIEKMGLLDSGEFKRYYTLVVDAVRHYLEARFRVDAMDRTTEELLADFESRRINVERLGELLVEADLVKFAKHLPARERGATAIRAAREIVAKTARRRATGNNGGGPSRGQADDPVETSPVAGSGADREH